MSIINSLIQFVSGTKAVAAEVNQNFETLRTSHNDQEDRIVSLESKFQNLTTVNVKDFGAKGDGIADDTTPIQNAVNAVFSSGGGTVLIPDGTYKVSTISKTWNGSVCVNILGNGKISTVIKKQTGDNDPVFDFSASSPVEIFSCIKDLKILGNLKNNDGVRVTNLSKFLIDNVLITECDKALNNLGSSTFTLFNCSMSHNNDGLYSRKSSLGAYYGNDITVLRSDFTNNVNYAIDFGQGSGFNVAGCSFENNGTSGNTSTGAVILRSNIVEEINFAVISIDKSTFQANKGITLKQEANSNANICIRDCIILHCESGNAVDLTPTRVIISNTIMPTTGDTLAITGGRAYIENSYINTLSNNATNKTELNVQTAFLQGRGFSSPLLVGNGQSVFMSWGSSEDYKHEFRNNTSTGNLEIRPYNAQEAVVFGTLALDSVAWNGNKLRLGGYYLWVDSLGKLRIKNSAPTSDTDGTAVGAQF